MSAEPTIAPFLRALLDAGGSDLHCKVGSPPRVRIDGRLRKLQSAALTPDDTEVMVSEVLRPDLVDQFNRTNEADFAYSLPGVGRFRVNAFRSRGSCGLVMRRVSVGAIPLEDLGLPPVISALSMEPRGLVLVTGPTGSGKTTTLAGMIDHVNENREVHVVTIEDPIEVLHYDKLSMINQREVKLDTAGFHTALRAAMRQDPDVILVGEMRDSETVKAALAAAETGHFVMSTLDGYGRCVTMEVLVNTGRIADAIADPEKTGTITQLISEGSYYGMQTFDQHLVSLIRDGVISLEAAMLASSSPHDLTVELRRLGLVA